MEKIHGRAQGLKPSILKQLQRLYRSRLPQDCFVTPEFAQRLAAVSLLADEPLCVFVDRGGRVERVSVGTPHHGRIPPLQLPRFGQGRLSGLRCIATQKLRLPPTEADLTAMALQSLDALVLLTVLPRGGIDRVYVSHLEVAEPPWVLLPPQSLDAVSQQDFTAFVANLERDRQGVLRQVATKEGDRVFLAGVVPQPLRETLSFGLTELRLLVESSGGTVLEVFWQKRDRPHPQTVLGEGKIQELAIAAQTQGANLVVFDRELSPAQIRNLEKLLGVRVSDRTEVILDIFAQRARSAAGKLQVELAQLEYRLPRLVGRGQELSRLGGGIGTRGPGETKLETDRRLIQRRITHLQHQVTTLQKQRARTRQQRIDREMPTVAIVGYTNAGKSTLLNALTKADVYAADQLFATLDPTTRRLTVLDNHQTFTVLLTDTVGFIHELPPSLVDAFRATLEEVGEADLLLHVVDAAHGSREQHIHSVRQILASLPTIPPIELLVFNKIDQVDDLKAVQTLHPEALYVSARDRLGLGSLQRTLVSTLWGRAPVPATRYTDSKLLS
ncbi:MAG: GTPase HflX [Oscillatoriales cyanobacterium SM2_2_1]|nr:GTPase HflX [Oscillatoriales cyanobacterium SM2_2_1]